MSPATRVAAAIGAGAAVLGLAGCGALHPQDFPANAPTASATANPAEVSAGNFGHTWPLSVDHGTVRCTTSASGDPVLTFTAPDGTVYALNSVPENRGRPGVGEIADGSIGTLRSFAFSVCGR